MKCDKFYFQLHFGGGKDNSFKGPEDVKYSLSPPLFYIVECNF
jgi:hypothetical protein